ncbi:MCE family protein [Mycolicibacterium sp. HS_4_1]
MKSLSERNPVMVGIAGVAITATLVVGALQYKELPFIDRGEQYSAYFAEASGLRTGAAVQVSGFRVGEVTSVRLDGPRVLIDFKIKSEVHLGRQTEVQIRTKSLLGAKVLEVLPRGEGTLSATIPLDRTRSAYQLPDALGDLAGTVNALNTDKLNTALSTLSTTFKDTPANLRRALAGVSRFSKTLNERDASLRSLLENANKATGVLAQRSDQIVNLIADTNALLAQLRTQSDALEHSAGNLSALAQQLSGFIADNRQQLKPALDKLNDVLTLVDDHKQGIKKSLHLLTGYLMSLGESVGSGPFFKAYLANLLPGQFVQPFVDAAFSDLGLDPHTLLPSQLHDPQTGQPGTPALPMPYPRTGQGGDPRMNLPDAITGHPGDPRYPYHEPDPAPPAGGPPPGAPADVPPPPIPTPVYVPAPGEPLTTGGQP